VSPIEWAGWLGNACFASRVLVQWLHVERLRSRAAPQIFWLLSLSGSALLGAYAVERGAWVLLVGFGINGLIYLRNLRLGDVSQSPRPLAKSQAVVLAVASLLALASAGLAGGVFLGRPWGWLGVAVIGQAIWSSRFVVQWWFSERARASHFPPVFWALSLVGNGLLLAYALHLGDAVLVAGFALGPIVQSRNLWLTRSKASPAGGRSSDPSGV
jgi:lipid-A-disaccharide synthase-like uncharacterized protein